MSQTVVVSADNASPANADPPKPSRRRKPQTRTCERCGKPGAVSFHKGREWYWFHPECREWFRTLLPSTRAARTLGVTIDRFYFFAAQYGMRPAFEVENPVFRCATPSLLWDLETFGPVREAIEEQAEEIARRKTAARKGVSTKTSKTLAVAEAWVPSVPQIELDTLVRSAVGHYNARKIERSSTEGYASEYSDPAFLARIIHNYLRHEATTYDAACASLFRRVGREAGYQTIRDAIDNAIWDVYPDLEDQLVARDSQPRCSQS